MGHLLIGAGRCIAQTAGLVRRKERPYYHSFPWATFFTASVTEDEGGMFGVTCVGYAEGGTGAAERGLAAPREIGP